MVSRTAACIAHYESTDGAHLTITYLAPKPALNVAAEAATAPSTKEAMAK